MNFVPSSEGLEISKSIITSHQESVKLPPLVANPANAQADPTSNGPHTFPLIETIETAEPETTRRVAAAAQAWNDTDGLENLDKSVNEDEKPPSNASEECQEEQNVLSYEEEQRRS